MRQYKKVEFNIEDYDELYERAYEDGYASAIEDAFLPVWEFLSFTAWITERDLTNAYLDFLSKDPEARKDWPETGSFVKLALRQFKMNGMIKEKDDDGPVA